MTPQQNDTAQSFASGAAVAGGDAAQQQQAVNGFLESKAREHARVAPGDLGDLPDNLRSFRQAADRSAWNGTFNELRRAVPGADINQAWSHYFAARNAYNLAYQDVSEQPDATAGQRLTGDESPEFKKQLEDAYATARWDLVDRPAMVKKWQYVTGASRMPDDNDLAYMAKNDQDAAEQLDRTFKSVPGYNIPLLRSAMTAIAKGEGKVLGLFAKGAGGPDDSLAAAGDLISQARSQSDDRQLNGLGKFLSNAIEAVGTVGTQIGLGGKLGIPTTVNLGASAMLDGIRSAKQKGLSDESALAYGISEGIVQGGLLALFPKAWQNLVGQGSEAAASFKQSLANAIKSLPAETAQNLGLVSAQTLGSAIAQKLSGVDPTARRGEKLSEAMADGMAQAVLGAAAHHAMSIGGQVPGAVGMARDAAAKLGLRMSADLSYNSGIKAHESGDYAKAITRYDEAIQQRPDDARYWHNRGIAKGENGDFQGAESDLRHAWELNPSDRDTQECSI